MALLVALFIVVPIVELYLIIQVGQAIGVVPTLVLLLADAILGSLLLRQQGRSAWQRFNTALNERRFPAQEVADGLMIAVGGTLLLTPGFVTDIFGLLLLIPPTRAVMRRLLRGFLGKRFLVVNIGSRVAGGPGPSAGDPRPNGRTYDFDGTAEEIDADDPRLPG
ncbi:MAG TPA: FxsA family protein [Solirubrobacterales bacterium]